MSGVNQQVRADSEQRDPTISENRLDAKPRINDRLALQFLAGEDKQAQKQCDGQRANPGPPKSGRRDSGLSPPLFRPESLSAVRKEKGIRESLDGDSTNA